MPEDKSLIEDVAGLGKLADSRLVNKVYDDALTGFMQQMGKFGEDIAKPTRNETMMKSRTAVWNVSRDKRTAYVDGKDPVLRDLVASIDREYVPRFDKLDENHLPLSPPEIECVFVDFEKFQEFCKAREQ